jgi:hypothetical protein
VGAVGNDGDPSEREGLPIGSTPLSVGRADNQPSMAGCETNARVTPFMSFYVFSLARAPSERGKKQGAGVPMVRTIIIGRKVKGWKI